MLAALTCTLRSNCTKLSIFIEIYQDLQKSQLFLDLDREVAIIFTNLDKDYYFCKISQKMLRNVKKSW